jgi:D-alanyl-D-alanine carboxypeptidase (penicillin-binding protein 5/6)
MRKYIIIISIPIILLTCGFGNVPRKTIHHYKKTNQQNKNNKYTLKCVAGVVIDQDSGRVLFSKNGDKILPMASTTKIMTALVAIEKGNLNDIVTVSKKAAMVSGSTAGLKAGEKVRLEELLYGLMLRSGNDAAITIAEHIGGSVEKFVGLMNEKAIEL